MTTTTPIIVTTKAAVVEVAKETADEDPSSGVPPFVVGAVGDDGGVAGLPPFVVGVVGDDGGVPPGQDRESSTSYTKSQSPETVCSH